MISVLLPSRRRPAYLARMIESLVSCSTEKCEVVVYADDDDPATAHAARDLGCVVVSGPRIILSDCWNKCFAACSGDIVKLGNDDMVFRSPGWNEQVEAAFASVPDRILMVHGNDGGGYWKDTFGVFPMVHRRWVETLGYFTPPYFSSDYGDTWLNDLANRINRRRYLPFVVEHLHFVYGKAKLDPTYNERLARHASDQVEEIWRRTEPERVRDAQKLCALLSRAKAGVA